MKTLWRGILMAMALLTGPVLLVPEPMSASETVISVEPQENFVTPGDTLTITIQATEASDLGAFEFFLAFDPSVLQFTAVEAGDFLTSTGRRLVPLGPELRTGQLAYGGATYGDEPGSNGGGVLARITFQVVGAGTSSLRFERLIITDTAANVLPVRGVDGQVTSSGEAYRAFLPLVTVMP